MGTDELCVLLFLHLDWSLHLNWIRDLNSLTHLTVGDHNFIKLLIEPITFSG